MTSKEQKFNNYSDELKNEIISKYISGTPSSRSEREYRVPQKTIRNWKKEYISHPELYPELKNKHERINESNLTKED